MKKRFLLVLILMICLTMFSGGILVHAQEKEQSEPVYYKYYTSIQVEAGDTLWALADCYACPSCISRDQYISEVKQLNGLKGDMIQAGDYLTVIYFSTEYK